MAYADRTAAAKVLAAEIKARDFNPHKTVLLALPRGGAPIAHVIASITKIPRGVIVVKKLVSPRYPEVAIGAMAADGTVQRDKSVQAYNDITDEDLPGMIDIIESTKKQIHDRVRTLRLPEKVTLDVDNVIIVDDGVATGHTAIVAAKYAKNLGAKHLIFATPVTPQDAMDKLRDYFSDIICPYITSDGGYSVSAAYENFSQIADDDVKALIDTAKKQKIFY